MATIVHLFHTQKRIEHGLIVSTDYVQRQAYFEYNESGDVVDITIIPVLSTKRDYLTKQDGYTLFYRGEDTDYRFVLECWPDNGTIKQLSVFRDDTGVEYRYIGNHEH